MSIKSIIETNEWQEIMAVFEKEILNNTDTKNIKETLSPEHIKLEIMSRNKAAKIVKRVLNKLNKMVEMPKEKIIYK